MLPILKTHAIDQIESIAVSRSHATMISILLFVSRGGRGGSPPRGGSPSREYSRRGGFVPRGGGGRDRSPLREYGGYRGGRSEGGPPRGGSYRGGYRDFDPEPPRGEYGR